MVFGRRNNEGTEYFISKPKTTTSVPYLVFLRTVTVMYVLFSATLLTMSTLFRPWKQENRTKSPHLFEVSIWKVCRTNHKGSKCYEGVYDNAPGWFFTIRWFLMTSVILMYIAVIFMIIKLAITKNGQPRKFWIAGYLCLASSILTLCAMLMLVGYWNFEFLEEVRMHRMGWKEDQDVEERTGYPLAMAWAAFAMIFTSFILCFYTHFKDKNYIEDYNLDSLQKQAYRAVYTNGQNGN